MFTRHPVNANIIQYPICDTLSSREYEPNIQGKDARKKNRNQVPPKAVTKSPLELPFEANFYYKYLPQLRYVILLDVDCMIVCNIYTASRSFIPAAYETTSIFGLCHGVVPP